MLNWFAAQFCNSPPTGPEGYAIEELVANSAPRSAVPILIDA